MAGRVPDLIDELPAEQRIAAAYMAAAIRPAFVTAFALDQRLARIVAKTTEPMLGQMRIAWWREALMKPAEDRPGGDAVLDAIAHHWPSDYRHLIQLVDAWEYMLAGEALGQEALQSFIEHRIRPLLFLAGKVTSAPTASAATWATRNWALADVMCHLADESERGLVRQMANEMPDRPDRLPRGIRGLIVLGALGARALNAGGAPLMQGRGAALVAMRAATLGF